MALLKGTLDVLVLKALSWGPMHGFEIITWLEDRSGGRLTVVDARVRLRAESEALVDHVTALAAVLTAKTLEP
jgi:hypothetical protein